MSATAALTAHEAQSMLRQAIKLDPRFAAACYAKMATVPPWSLIRLVICHSELGEIGQARDVLAKVKAHYSELSLDEIVDAEVDFYEDPAVCSRYRAILRRVDKGE